MIEPAEFAHAISAEIGLSEVDLVVRAAWFLRKESDSQSIPVEEATKFLSVWSVRPNINLSRLKKKLKKAPNVSFRADGMIHIPLNSMRELDALYSGFLKASEPHIEDTILELIGFENGRPYVKALVRQINGSHQFGFYDCCAVLMRRLAEVLIIDAYTKKGEDIKIRGADGNLQMMNGLINALKSGQTFRLSRNAPNYLETLKTLGDTAAHSRNYITKKKDIDDFSQKYRMLVEELNNLV
jgi:hypothetical protein